MLFDRGDRCAYIQAMLRRPTDQLLRDISAQGQRYLPCPRRKDHASLAVEVCKTNCRYARRCAVFQAWLRPPLLLLDQA